MRSAAGLGVLVIAGCNQIFGLEQTAIVDASVDPDAAYRRAQLTYAVALTTATSQAPNIVQAGVTPDPMVRVGPLAGDLVAARYVAGADVGELEYPPELLGTTWRVEYTPPGGIPHEVQWNPPDGAGHLVIPYFGAVPRMPAPPGTGYTLRTATNVVWPATTTVIYTTGYWTRTELPGSASAIPLDLGTIAPASGQRGRPDPTKDDVVVIGYADSGACRRAQLTASYAAADLVDGTLVDLNASVASTLGDAISVVYAPANAAIPPSRLAAALGTRSNALSTASRSVFGAAAHTAMPGFPSTFAGIPAPLMIPLVECPLGQLDSVSFTTPTALIDYAGVLFAYAIDQRVRNGVALPSSIVTIGVSSSDAYPANFNVPLAITPKLGAIDLDGPEDAIAIPRTRAELTFALDVTGNPDFGFDTFEVVLHRLDATAAVPVRVYASPNPAQRSITFDPAVMVPGVEYAFAIRTIRGRPGAAAFDMTQVAQPQAMGSVFTRTFVLE